MHHAGLHTSYGYVFCQSLQCFKMYGFSGSMAFLNTILLKIAQFSLLCSFWVEQEQVLEVMLSGALLLVQSPAAVSLQPSMLCRQRRQTIGARS